MPYQYSINKKRPFWHDLEKLTVNFVSPKGEFMCEWDSITSAPVSEIIPRARFMKDNEEFYNSSFVVSIEEIVNDNLAGRNGETLSIDELVEMYGSKEMLSIIGWNGIEEDNEN